MILPLIHAFLVVHQVSLEIIVRKLLIEASTNMLVRGKKLQANCKPINCIEKDGDWCIYPQFLAYENRKKANKNEQKSFKIFKPCIHNVVSTGTNFKKKKKMAFYLPVGCMR